MATPPAGPPIPVRAAHRPTVAGLVVPYVTPQRANRSWAFGAVWAAALEHCLRHRLCGVCGRRLSDRVVLLMRDSDLRTGCTPEAGLDPVCAAYTTGGGCPMLSGRMEHYRMVPHGGTQDGWVPAVDSHVRAGRPADRWWAVWVADYTLTTDPGGNLAASITASPPLQIRPIGHLPARRGEPLGSRSEAAS